MKLPNLEKAVITQAKITEYLLSPTKGRGKADFFTRFGFLRDSWEILADALRNHAADHEVEKVEASPFGTRYVIEGTIQTPAGRSPHIRAVWFINKEDNAPRFVTTYPLRSKEG